MLRRLAPDLPFIAFLLLAIFALLGWFLPVFWYAQDDGIFAYLADRVLRGDRYGLDVMEAHPGYHHFLDAGLFAVFGRDTFNLRLPFFILVPVQALIAYFFIRPQGRWMACLAALAVAVVGIIQFPNPSPSWYALAFAFIIAFLMTKPDRGSWLLMAGLVLGITFMFRHPSAVFIGAGVLFYLMMRGGDPAPDRPQRAVLSWTLLTLILAGLIFYNVMVFEISIFIMFGLWPLLLCAMVFYDRLPLADDGIMFRRLCWLGLGFIATTVPMFIYMAVAGRLWSWLDISFLSASDILQRDFVAETRYLHQFTDVLWPAFIQAPGIYGAIEIFFWVYLFALPILVGFVACIKLRDAQFRASAPAIFWMAPFFYYCSYYFQTASYFFYSVGFTLVAWHVLALWPRGVRFALLGLVVVMGGLFAHANYPRLQYVPASFAGLGLRIDPAQNADYVRILDIIAAQTKGDDAILSYPMDPQFYFLSGRRNPLAYPYTPCIMTSEADFAAIIDQLRADPPRLVIFSARNKYVGPYERKLDAWFRDEMGYKVHEQVEPFVILLRP